jgi:hypothetical protein
MPAGLLTALALDGRIAVAPWLVNTVAEYHALNSSRGPPSFVISDDPLGLVDACRRPWAG